MFYILAHVVKDRNIVIISHDNTIQGTEKESEALGMLPNFDTYHGRGLTWSTSATLYWMNFQPRIITFKDMEELESAVQEDKRVHTFSHISGNCRGLYLKEDYTPVVYRESELISNKFKMSQEHSSY